MRRLLSRISGSKVGSCTPGFCAPEQVDLRLGAEARGRGFEDRVDVYQLANLALDLIGAEARRLRMEPGQGGEGGQGGRDDRPIRLR